MQQEKEEPEKIVFRKEVTRGCNEEEVIESTIKYIQRLKAVNEERFAARRATITGTDFGRVIGD